MWIAGVTSVTGALYSYQDASVTLNDGSETEKKLLCIVEHLTGYKQGYWSCDHESQLCFTKQHKAHSHILQCTFYWTHIHKKKNLARMKRENSYNYKICILFS